jgi:hypothetical protein
VLQAAKTKAAVKIRAPAIKHELSFFVIRFPPKVSYRYKIPEFRVARNVFRNPLLASVIRVEGFNTPPLGRLKRYYTPNTNTL